ncbi:MAG: UPF0179 family protein [Candidatus Asgardarchaeia archaeon]
MVFITLLSKSVAKEGYRFQYFGEASACKKCEFYHICHEKMENGRVYEVIKVRKNKEQFCKLVDDYVVPVEVDEVEHEILINVEKAIEGAVITYTPLVCSEYDCEYKPLCNPIGLFDKDRVQIIKILSSVECGNSVLKKVRVKRVTNS